MTANSALSISAAGERLRFDNFLPCRLKLLAQRTVGLLALTHEGVGISEAEFGIMVVLSEREGASSRDIHKTTAMDKAMITRALDRLAEKRLISRSGSKRDRRLNHVKLTSEGRRLFGLIEQRALQWERDFLHGVKVTELNQLSRTLSKLEANLDGLGTQPRP